MSEFRARIGRVRMKNGGADVRVLDRKDVNPGGEDWRGSVVSSARKIAENATDENPLVGYVIVGIYPNGTSVGWRYDWDHSMNSQIPRMLLPAWIAEIIRRDMIAEVSARDVFDEMFEWREG